MFKRIAPFLFAAISVMTAGQALAQPGGMPLPGHMPTPGIAMHAPSYPADLKPTYGDIAYAKISKAETLDLFLPKGTGPFPLVINIHGGAFLMGDKKMLDAPLAKELLKNGIAVATINYRLSGEAPFPAALEDAKAAVRFLRANAGKFRLAPGKFLTFGQSAGGNIAAMVGVTGDIATSDAPALGNAGVSSRVQGVIDWFGPSDFTLMDAQAKAQGCSEKDQTHGKPDSPESRYIGAVVGEHPGRYALSNPITYISKATPPFLNEKGTLDCVVPVAQSQVLHEALVAAGVASELVLLDGAGHGDMGSATPQFLSPENMARVVAFVKRVTAP